MSLEQPVPWPHGATPGDRKIRVLALDGGPSTLANLSFLRELTAWQDEQWRTGDAPAPIFARVLGMTDVIAGTSGGAIIGLWLATRMHELRTAEAPRVLEILDECLAFAMEMYQRLEPDLRGLLRMFTGRSALSLSGHGTKAPPRLWGRLRGERVLGFTEWLDQQYGGQRLHDVPVRVVVPTFQMGFNERLSGPIGPKLFHNLVEGASCAWLSPTATDSWALFAHAGISADGAFHTDPNPRLSDLATWSGAFPMAYPVAGGHVDGAFVANNPSLAAVALARSAMRWKLAERLHTGLPAQPPPAGLGDVEHDHNVDDVRVMSFGSVDARLGSGLLGRIAAGNGGTHPWGYAAWLLNPRDPLLLVGALLGGQVRSENLMTNLVVGSPNVLRVATTPGLSTVSTLLNYLLLPSNKLWQHAQQGSKVWTANGALQLAENARTEAEQTQGEQRAELLALAERWEAQARRIVDDPVHPLDHDDPCRRAIEAGHSAEAGWIADFCFARSWLYSRWLLDADYEMPEGRAGAM